MFRTAIGHAEGIDTARVTTQALEHLANDLQRDIPKALIVFASASFEHDLLLTLVNEAYPNAEVVGGTSGGEFSSTMGLSDDSVAILAFVSDTATFASISGCAKTSKISENMKSAYNSLKEQLGEQPKVVIPFVNGHKQPVSRVLIPLNELIEEGTLLFGAQVGFDANHPHPPMVYHGISAEQESYSVLAIGGAIKAETVASQSWKPIGTMATVTKSEGPVIHEIDGVPALQFYRRYLGNTATPMLEYPFALLEEGFDDFFVRAATAHSEQDLSITVSGDVPVGSRIQITESRPQKILEDTHKNIRSLSRGDMEHASIVLALSCAARKTILGTKAGKELEVIQQALPCPVPVFGMFSFGEIGPLQKGAISYMNNHTLLCLFLGEEGGQACSSPVPKQCSAASVPVPSIQEIQHEKDFLVRKLTRAELNLAKLEESKEASLTLSRNLHENLRKSEEKYRRILETCSEGFIFMDDSRTIQYVNDSWLRLTGHTRDAVLGTLPRQYLDKASALRLERASHNLQDKGYLSLEAILKHKDGHDIPILVHANRLTGDDGEFLGFFSFITDLTEQKKALQLAGAFQQSLLPSTPPQIPGLDLAGKSIPCDEVGGDYFDYLCPSDGTCRLTVADVSGHGVDASLLMSSVRSYLRSYTAETAELDTVVTKLNAQLAQDVSRTGRFVTMFHLLADPVQRRLAWVRAGHDPALVYTPETESFSELMGDGLPLGVLEDTAYSLNLLEDLPENAIIILSTDGITESRNPKDEMFGRQRLKDVIKAHAHEPSANIRDAIFNAVTDFSEGASATDDLTLLIAKFS